MLIVGLQLVGVEQSAHTLVDASLVTVGVKYLDGFGILSPLIVHTAHIAAGSALQRTLLPLAGRIIPVGLHFVISLGAVEGTHPEIHYPLRQLVGGLQGGNLVDYLDILVVSGALIVPAVHPGVELVELVVNPQVVYGVVVALLVEGCHQCVL